MADCDDLDAAATRGRLGHLLQPGRGLQCRLAPARRTSSIKDEFLEKVVKRRRAHPARRPARPGHPAWARSSTRRSWNACSATSRRARGRRRRCTSAASSVRDRQRRLLRRADDLRRRRQRHDDRPGGDLRAGARRRSRSTTLDEAITIANDTIYGLAAGDLDRRHDARRIATPRRCGPASSGSTCFDRGDMSAPFGGFKQSGFGRDKSMHALDKYTD